ncbi:pyridoxal 5'-phosphate synthase glutaminase subunit PdxT [Eubacterium sp.]|uniref:pyridoxal 5'-phosphate synthase glutaminase subunit PdxT n=1 Tax=Eubacterium sp. TaxID=142586 RepID=UPI004028CFF0
MRIGVLALQGAFEEHIKMLNALGVETFEIRQLKDLSEIPDGLIIPGGESTVMSKLLDELNIRDKILEYADKGMAVFGTCAGLFLLCKNTGDPRCKVRGLLDCTAKRNAYGRQLGSFETIGKFDSIGEIPMVFIRAPYVSFAEDDVQVLSTVNGKIVGVRQNRILATAFHPELTADLSVHKYFIDMIKNR